MSSFAAMETGLISRDAGPLFNFKVPAESGRNTVRLGVTCTV